VALVQKGNLSYIPLRSVCIGTKGDNQVASNLSLKMLCLCTITLEDCEMFELAILCDIRNHHTEPEGDLGGLRCTCR
jgi:hypothetical protein